MRGQGPELVLMAAGLGSRYGGLKQVEPVGLAGETLLDYTIYDALRAGFGRVVFVIRRAIEAEFRAAVGRRFESRLDVTYVFQELEDPAPARPAPADRVKPWGTGHAVLAAAGAVRGPFAVANADDFYGAPAWEVLGRHLQGPAGSAEAALVAFRLRDTLSEHGTVARGVCRVGPEARLEEVEELTRIEPDGTGGGRALDDGGRTLAGDTPVSMNLWGFPPRLVDHLAEGFQAFSQARGDDPGAEFLLPAAVCGLVRSGRLTVRVLAAASTWFGVTYRPDLPRVRAAVAGLARAGVYPDPLWG